MKLILFSTAMVAAILSSCSKNEMVENLPQTENPDAIGLSIGIFTTKSAAITTNDLNTDGKKLTLYSTSSDFGNLGELVFTYTSGSWLTAGDQTWENIDFTSPVNIYSMHDGNTISQGNLAVTPATGAASAYTIEEDVANERDLIYFGKSFSAIPPGSTIAATYKHALSRVKMQNITAASMTVDAMMVKIKGFDGTGIPTITASSNTVTWSENNDETDAEYAYDLANEATMTNDMYIIPQTVAMHAGSGNSVIAGVEALCYTHVGNTRIAGWDDVTNFKKANPSVTSVKYTDGGTEYTSGKMYVKVVFPLSNITFTDGIYYNLQLNFAGKSLQYVDGKYYDTNGKELVVTGDTVTLGPKADELVNPNPSSNIGLTVQVNPWPAAIN